MPARDERLRWLTGFTGSAGLCIALRRKAGVFVDGRYTLQAKEQLHLEAFKPVALDETKPSEWLAEALSDGDVLGYDPWLLTEAQREGYERAAVNVGATLRGEPDNPIDAIWEDQPPAPMGSARPHPLEFAGAPSALKRENCAGKLREKGLDAFVLTLPDSINWLLNIRGGDIAHTPVALCFAILKSDATLDLFIDPDKVDRALAAHLGEDVRLHEPAELVAALAGWSARAVGVEKASAPAAIGDALRDAGAALLWEDDPCVMPKARKNAAELAGARAAHLRDGAAMARFLCWADRKIGEGRLKEIKAARRLEQYRADTNKLEDISFDTISAYGPHGAMPHYRVSRETNLSIDPGSLFLIDSGGQYRDGTTDITRTIAVGAIQARHKRAFTLVLKGMIAVSRARFPAGTTGAQIDVMARAALWREGFDYDHGTGHGVGAFLSVHEGPARIARTGTVPLEPGMILSNEPGYYREEDFGVRIENLLAVTEAETPEGGERPMMGFETLTLAPIDLRVIEPALLNHEEIDWFDRYHERVYEALYPMLDEPAREWLEHATAPVAKA